MVGKRCVDVWPVRFLLRNNFAAEDGSEAKPPKDFIARLMEEPLGDFDPTEVVEGVFIRRKAPGR